MNEVHHSFTTNFSFPKITAKSDSDDDDIINPNSILDQVQLDYLKETVYDLSSFHTRHTESENIVDVASWLTENLQISVVEMFTSIILLIHLIKR